MNSIRPFARVLVAILAMSLVIGCAHVRPARAPASAIHQVGLVWLKKPGNAEDRRKIVEAVQEFGRSIPEVQNAVAGRTDGIGGPYSDISYDVCFILTFPDEAARQRYNEHPVHQKAAQEVFLPLSRKLLFYRFIGE